MSAPTVNTAEISWDEDFRDRVNPELMTALLRSSIPVLEQSNWSVVRVGEGHCETMLPLNKATTNQHGTHQAALISLSADYTGGLALATLLRGVPLAGIHPCREDVSASLWLAGMNVRYKAPSTGHLTGICEISEDQASDIKRRYFAGSRVLATLHVQFFANGELTAEAEMKYFAQPTIQLSPAAPKPSKSTLFNHKLKASARMIAGIRAQRSAHEKIHAQCPHAGVVAGPHGELLANHLRNVLPQLQDMVQFRSQHIDELIEGLPGLRQVVLAGAGLDMRSIRHAALMPDVTFFELDLPEMIAERQRVTRFLDDDFQRQRVMIAADFKNDDVAELLLRQPAFDASLPTVIVFEGCSMYFSHEENQRLFRSFRQLLQHPLSCVWSDFVDTSVVSRRTNNHRVIAFLEGMDTLGESFVFGTDEPAEWLAGVGFNDVSTVTAADYAGEIDAVFNMYAFTTSRP